MFGFGKKKVADSSGNKRRSVEDKEKLNDQLAKLGLIGIPGVDGGDNESDVSDGDLENELLEILGEENPADEKELLDFLQEDDSANVPAPPKRKNKAPPKPESDVGADYMEQEDPIQSQHYAHVLLPDSPDKKSQEKSVLPNNAVRASETLPAAPPPPATVLEALQQRLAKYQSETDKAKQSNDAGKSRRMGRIVKQYEDAIKSYTRGKPIDFEELPTPPGFAPIPIPVNSSGNTAAPVVENSYSPPTVSRLQPLPPKDDDVIDLIMMDVDDQQKSLLTSAEKEEQLNTILSRQKEFKIAALNAKKRGDVEEAKELLRISKILDKLLEATNGGEHIDLASLPALPELVATPQKENLELITSSDTTSVSEKVDPATTHVVSEMEIEGHPDDAADIFKAPPPPATVLEALQQRLEKYKSEVDKAKANGDASKSRRMGRIVKQYEDAVKSYKNGKPVEYEELPTPPGFAPIPINPPVPAQQSASAGPSGIPTPPAGTSAVQPQRPTPPKQVGSINRGDNKPGTKLTLQEKQLNTILTRQKQYREAALNAKKRDDLEQAKEFLRTAKGFDKLINVSKSGLPVDMASLPPAPESVAELEAEDFELVTSSDCIPASGSTADIFVKLEADLKEQLTVCMRTRDHFKTIGDIASANRFEHMALESKKDLDTLRLAIKKENSIPKYHYETKIFSITECNSDLREDDIEISIMKGINFKVANPDDVDTFVKVELPYPTAEEVQTTKTAVVKNSNNPDYNATFKMVINRSARNFPRFVRRHGFKLEVWSKGGLFRSSSQIGVATVKLTALESKCVLHDAFDVMDGRKVVGKIEVKVRLRDPVVTKEITQKKQKWLSIDRV